jgi:hypothetical protein
VPALRSSPSSGNISSCPWRSRAGVQQVVAASHHYSDARGGQCEGDAAVLVAPGLQAQQGRELALVGGQVCAALLCDPTVEVGAHRLWQGRERAVQVGAELRPAAGAVGIERGAVRDAVGALGCPVRPQLIQTGALAQDVAVVGNGAFARLGLARESAAELGGGLLGEQHVERVGDRALGPLVLEQVVVGEQRRDGGRNPARCGASALKSGVAR